MHYGVGAPVVAAMGRNRCLHTNMLLNCQTYKSKFCLSVTNVHPYELGEETLSVTKVLFTIAAVMVGRNGRLAEIDTVLLAESCCDTRQLQITFLCVITF